MEGSCYPTKSLERVDRGENTVALRSSIREGARETHQARCWFWSPKGTLPALISQKNWLPSSHEWYECDSSGHVMKPNKPTSVLKHIAVKMDRDAVERLIQDCHPSGVTFFEVEALYQAAKGNLGSIDPRIKVAIALYEIEDDRMLKIVDARKWTRGKRTVTVRQRRELNRILDATEGVSYERVIKSIKYDTQSLLDYLHGGDGWKSDMMSGKNAAHQAKHIFSKRMTEGGGRGRPIDEPIRNLLLRLLAVYSDKQGDPPKVSIKGTHAVWKWMYDLKVLKTFLHKRITMRKVLAAIGEYQAICRYNAKSDNRQG